MSEQLKATVLSDFADAAVVKLDNQPNPSLALSESTYFGLLASLEKCQGFVAGALSNEEAVQLIMLVNRLREIGKQYREVSELHGFELENAKSAVEKEYEAARAANAGTAAENDKASDN